MPKLKFFLATLLALSGSAMAAGYDAPQLIFSSPDRTVNLSGGIGYSWIRADEKVYFEGYRLSHLIWTSQTPVFTAAMSINPLADLTIDAKTRIGFLATSRMEDYDWFGPFFKSFAFDDWTHRSMHEVVDLERFVTADIALGYNLNLNNSDTINLNGGFKYLNVKFNGSEGTSTYSISGFRADVSTFASGLRGISYEVRLPAFFAGTKWTHEFSGFSISAAGRLGTTFGARDIDMHWLRDRLSTSQLNNAPFVELNADLNYHLAKNLQFVSSVAFERYFEMTGDDFITFPTETLMNFGGRGVRFGSLSLSFGIKSSF